MWISVNDKLPPENLPVWSLYPDGSIHMRALVLEQHPEKDELCWLWANVMWAPTYFNGKWDVMDIELDDDYSGVTHWQRLPEPPC